MTLIELRKLANEWIERECDEDDIRVDGGSTSINKLMRAYIAAANPAAVISLLDQIQALQAERDALAAKLATLEADAERLDWLQKTLFVHRWNGVVGSGCATQWSIAPDYRHTVAKMKTGDIEIDFRAAIDAAKGGQQ